MAHMSRPSLNGISLLLTILALWSFASFGLSSLHRSFWIDEFAVLVFAEGKFSDIFIPFLQGHSTAPLYPLIMWLWVAVMGHEEFVVRIPSTIAVGLAGLWLYRLLILCRVNRSSAALLALLWLQLPVVQFAATNARPYGVACLLSICSLYYFCISLEQPGKRYPIFLTALLGLLAGLLHYLFFPIIAVQLASLIALSLWNPQRSFATFRQLLICYALLFVPVTPALAYLWLNRHTVGYLKLYPSPDLQALATALFPAYFLITLTLYLLFTEKYKKTKSRTPPLQDLLLPHALTSLLLWLAPIVLLFLVSVMTTARVFESRYYMLSTFGLILVMGLLGKQLTDRRHQTILVGTPLLVLMLGLAVRGPTVVSEDWRSGAHAVIATQREDPNTAVILLSGFYGQGNQIQKEHSYLDRIFRAPLQYYGVSAPIHMPTTPLTNPSSFFISKETVEFIEPRETIVLVSRGTESLYAGKVRSYLESRGFRNEGSELFRNVQLYRFRRYPSDLRESDRSELDRQRSS